MCRAAMASAAPEYSRYGLPELWKKGKYETDFGSRPDGQEMACIMSNGGKSDGAIILLQSEKNLKTTIPPEAGLL